MARPTVPGAAGRRLLVAVLVLIVAQAAGAEDEGKLLQELESERQARAELEVMVEQLQATVQELATSRDEAVQKMEGLSASVESLRAEIAPAAARRGEQVGITKEQESRYQAEREFLERRGGVLLPAGQLLFEPGFEYSNDQRNRIQIAGFSLIPAIIIGTIDTVDIERDFYRGFLTSRYGLTDWLEAEVTVPYIKRRDKEIIGVEVDPEQTTLNGDGLGDVSGGLFAQVLRGRGWVPDTVLNFRFAAPTGKSPFEVDLDMNGNPTELAVGTGFWSLATGATFSKTLDPAVVFGSASYFWNLSDTKSGFGEVDPGDSFEWSTGIAFGLNERIAMSLSFQQRIAWRTELDGEDIFRTDLNAATLFAGVSYRINQWTSLSFNVGVGITDDAPDLTLEVRLPLRMPFRLPVLKIPSLPWLADRKSGHREFLADRKSGDREFLMEDEPVASRWGRRRDLAQF